MLGRKRGELGQEEQQNDSCTRGRGVSTATPAETSHGDEGSGVQDAVEGEGLALGVDVGATGGDGHGGVLQWGEKSH